MHGCSVQYVQLQENLWNEKEIAQCTGVRQSKQMFARASRRLLPAAAPRTAPLSEPAAQCACLVGRRHFVVHFVRGDWREDTPVGRQHKTALARHLPRFL